jgi:endogenous inhibitor of DNA gyrase (YacG/DUF329 family)/G:T-mismatch repair DNA endonuclease (very short patch repair protein)
MKRVKICCSYCGKEFEVGLFGASSRKFCSKRCEGLYRRARVTLICLGCGEEFEVRKSDLRQNRKFCSWECYLRYINSEEGRKQMCEIARIVAQKKKKCVKIKCSYCGKEFEAILSLAGSRKFCSKKCAGLAKRKKVKIICHGCGREFESEEWLVKKGYGKFCSRECWRRYLNSEEGRVMKSKITSALWQNPEFRQKTTRVWHDPCFRAEFIKKVVKAREVRPTRLEKVVNDLLQGYFPGEWVYVGDGKITVEGFIPDFVHKEQKWIIEVNGDYWHSLPENRKRDKVKTKVYVKNGYKVFEIWESEVYSDPKSIVGKVLSFFYGRFRWISSDGDSEGWAQKAVNTPVQSAASDIAALTGWKIAGRLRSEGFKSRLVNFVHDSVIIDCPGDEVDEVCGIIRDEVGKIELPEEKFLDFEMDIEVGRSWGETKEKE